MQPMKVEYEGLYNTNLLLSYNERVYIGWTVRWIEEETENSEASNARLVSALDIVNEHRKGVISESIVHW